MVEPAKLIVIMAKEARRLKMNSLLAPSFSLTEADTAVSEFSICASVPFSDNKRRYQL